MRPACCRLGLVPEAFTGLLHCATGPGEAALPLRPLRDQLRSFHRGAPVPLPLHPIQTSPLLPFGPCLDCTRFGPCRTVPALVPPGLYLLWSLSDCSGPCPHCFGSGALLAQSCLMWLPSQTPRPPAPCYNFATTTAGLYQPPLRRRWVSGPSGQVLRLLLAGATLILFDELHWCILPR